MYLSLSLSIYIYDMHIFFPHADRGHQIIMPMLEGGGLCRGSLTWPGALGVGHARSSRETWKALGAVFFW